MFHRVAAIVSLLLLTAVVAFAREGCDEPSADEYAAYAAFVRAHRSFFKGQPIIIVNATFTPTINKSRTPKALENHPELVEEFNALNERSVELDRLFPLDIEYTLITPQELDSWLSLPRTQGQRSEVEAGGVPIRFSRVAFERDGLRGLFMAQQVFRGARHSYLLIVEKSQGEWVWRDTVRVSEALLEGPPGQDAFVVERVSEIVRAHYLFPETAGEIAAHVKRRWQDGAYSGLDSMREFTELLTADLQSISGDRHLSVVPGRDVAVTEERMREKRRRLAETHHGFNKVDRLPGNVGYVEITEFCPLDSAGEAMRQAFASLAGSAAVILDLRGNKGGSGDMVPLICGHFLGARTHLYDIVDPRTGEVEKVSTPKETDPPRMTEIPLYVLTNAETYSAAECLAYTLQSLAEAVVVGERTAGGAHPTRSFVIREAEIVVTVPVRNMVNPRTGTNWEGAGVKPDLEVPADLALETALEHYRKRAETARRPD